MSLPGPTYTLGWRIPSVTATFLLAGLWVAEPYLVLPAMARGLSVAGCVGLAVFAAVWEARRSAARESSGRRYLESLCQLDPHELSSPELADTLPPLNASPSWRSTFERVRQRFIECGRRADEAEHAHTAGEVRLRRLESENARLREMLDRIPEPVVAVNEYDEITWLNEPARELFRVAAADQPLGKLDKVIRCEPLTQILTETRRRKCDVHRIGEFAIRDEAGASRWCRIVCRTLPPTAAGSTHRGALAVLTDISHEKGIQKRHAEFVAAAAHEMRTPLSSIRAYVELLHDGEVDDGATQEEFWDVIQVQSDRLQRLIENLLNLARIEAGVVKVDKRTQSLNEILEQAYGVVQPGAEQKQLELVRDLSPMYLGVYSDRDMVLQAAINLLSNAVKYTPAGGKVILRSRMDDQAVVFEVEDTGVGLSPEDCRKVFEKFYRVKKDQQMAPGTGLGLSLAKHIIEDVHGGSLTVTSQEGAGSIFRVTLPSGGQGPG